MATQRFLPNIRLMARAFHRGAGASTTIQSKSSGCSTTTTTGTKVFSTSSKLNSSKPEDNANVTKDEHNVQFDEAKKGKKDRAESLGKKGESAATSEKGHGGAEKAKQEHPEAPGPVIGMEDERGGKGQ